MGLNKIAKDGAASVVVVRKWATPPRAACLLLADSGFLQSRFARASE